MSLSRRSLLGAFGLTLMQAPSPARAQTGAVSVVELFTSQGCSSCPPADALIGELAREPGVIALSYPVEIWDYLGWKDTLAKPAFTRRQHAYAALIAGKRVYTPQTIINGRAHCVGSDAGAIARLRRAMLAGGPKIALQRDARGIRVEIEGGPGEPGHLMLVFLSAQQDVMIERGENRGRAMRYTNVVRDLRPVADYAGGPHALVVPAHDLAETGSDTLAVFAQNGTPEAPGAIRSAALITLALPKP